MEVIYNEQNVDMRRHSKPVSEKIKRRIVNDLLVRYMLVKVRKIIIERNSEGGRISLRIFYETAGGKRYFRGYYYDEHGNYVGRRDVHEYTTDMLEQMFE